jgi:hypothetical protein
MTLDLRRLAAVGSVFTFGLLSNALANSTYECTTEDVDCLDSVFVIELRDKEGKFDSLCTGVAISPRIIVTAAHCIEDTRDDKGSWVIYVGATYDQKDSKPYRKVVDNGIHPDYDADKTYYEYDIGYLVVDRPMPQSLHYPEIPYDLPRLRKGDELLRVGYGRRRNHNRMALAYPTFERFLKDDGYPHVMKLKDDDSYGGDSGGPLFLDTEEGMILMAVHSTVEEGRTTQATDRIYAPLLTPALDWLDSETAHLGRQGR